MEEKFEIDEKDLFGGRRLEAGERVLVKDLGNFQGDSIFGITTEMKKLSNQYVTIRTSKISEITGNRKIAAYTVVEADCWLNWNNFMFVLDEPEEPKVEEEVEKIEIRLDAGVATEEEIKKMISLVNIETFISIIKNRCYEDGSAQTREINAKITEELAKDYLQTWAINKYRFYKMFGDKLYIEKEIEVRKTREFYDDSIRSTRAKYPLYAGFLDMISSCDIENNKMSSNSNSILYNDARVKTGMKFTKVAALFNDNDFNMELSKMYQDKSTKKIRISIDPNDFLTVSINKYGWRSCHNFFDGEFRNAGLALLNDRTSLVAYSSTDDEYKYDYKFKFAWNSKNWRQMIYISEDNSNMAFSLCYPNRSEEIEVGVRNMIEEKFAKYLDIPNVWRISSSDCAMDIEVECSEYMYNDIGRSGCKYIINKYDKNRGTTFYTGVGVMSGIVTGEEYYESEDSIW